MLESLTIFNKGGLVHYQYLESSEHAITNNSTEDLLNAWLADVYLNPTKPLEDRKALLDHVSSPTKVVVEWEETSDFIAVALSPDIRQEGMSWIRSLLLATIQEYQLFLEMQQQNQENQENNVLLPLENSLFDNTFQVLFKQHKSGKVTATASNANTNNANNNNNKQSKSSNKGKEKRQWHDGKAKVTKEAMAELDRSKAAGGDNIVGDDNELALAEARAAYLPTDADLANFSVQPTVQIDDNASDDAEGSWGASLKGLFQQVTGQKVLNKQDLEQPLKEMHKVLTSKNVATDIAQLICNNVEQQLVSKRLNSMYRVKTAVRQALESVINKLLAPSAQLDLLRQVVSKRDAWISNKRPFVIVVVGINGVGKSTSLAKLAYYLKTNGCKPLLAACDTFRSGAVEQLSVHAKCLDLPIYHKGYSKDPSIVAKAAIEQAIQDKNDVVLVDTAGRMQNNVPLMKALGKLAHENQPDMIVFVGEALVGNDGVDQVRK
jgi:signal recognition particle receptor subunit alpha